MKRRSPLRISHLLTISLITAGLVCAGFFTQPQRALAARGVTAAPIFHYVTFNSNGHVTEHATQANTVGDFLRERGIVPALADYAEPSLDTPISDHLFISYRAAVGVTILNVHVRTRVVSAAPDVAALLEEQRIRLGVHDRVYPALTDSVPANGLVHVERVLTWERTEKRRLVAKTVRRLDFSMNSGTSRVLAKGTIGERDVMVQFTQSDGGRVRRAVIGAQVVRKAHPRIVAEGVGAYDRRAGEIQPTDYVTQSALAMEATAYTADCAGCSGITAIGRPAGRGIVAVDPRVIPLGTRLYIPGYGFALAGDTGGAIVGDRIDLGFNSLRDAMEFGRHEVTVYRLR